MDLTKIQTGVMAAFLVMVSIIAIAGGAFIAMMFQNVVFGYIVSVQSTLAIDATVANFSKNISAGYYSVMGSILSGITTAGTLLPLVVILLIFGAAGFIGYQYIKGRKSGSVGRGGNMNYGG